MRRILLVIAVTAVMTVLLAMPAFALKGGVGEKPDTHPPSTYGECTSAIAATGAFPGHEPTTPKEWTDATSPGQSAQERQGNTDESSVTCQGAPPPPG
jgi:hypothetical protein